VGPGRRGHVRLRRQLGGRREDAVVQHAGTSAATVQSTVCQWMSQVSGVLGQLASPTTLSANLGLTPTSSSLTGAAFPSNSIVGSMLYGIGGS